MPLLQCEPGVLPPLPDVTFSSSLFVLLFASGLLLFRRAVFGSPLLGNRGVIYIAKHRCSDAIAHSPIMIAEMSDEFQKKPLVTTSG